MQPPAVRRRVTFALSLTLEAALLAAAPLLLAVAAVAQAMGRPKPMIAVRSLLTYCARELGVLAAGGGLWLLAGGGRLLRRPRLTLLHWRLLRWFVHGVAAKVLALLGIQVSEDCAAPAAALLAGEAPVIILSRHAGPGDTVFLINHLIERYGRRPSVVLRREVALDPAIGLLTRRLPHGVIDPSEAEEACAVIERLAAELGPHGALLIYPEGGNFSRERRRRALGSLRRRGRDRALAAARRMTNVLPPQPLGVLAALRGNSEAPVVFVAHTGLGLAAYPREIYRELPIGRRLRFRVWAVPRDQVPTDGEERTAWLNGWWQKIDAWIRAQRTEPVPEASAAPDTSPTAAR